MIAIGFLMWLAMMQGYGTPYRIGHTGSGANWDFAVQNGVDCMNNINCGGITYWAGDSFVYLPGNTPASNEIIFGKPEDIDLDCPSHFWKDNGHGIVVCQSPMDVPAIQDTSEERPLVLRDPNNCVDGWIANALFGSHCASNKYWKCKDQSRILLTAENGTKHCIRF